MKGQRSILNNIIRNEDVELVKSAMEQIVDQIVDDAQPSCSFWLPQSNNKTSERDTSFSLISPKELILVPITKQKTVSRRNTVIITSSPYKTNYKTSSKGKKDRETKRREETKKALNMELKKQKIKNK